MGAKKKNINATRTGIYARHYTDPQRKALDGMPPTASEHEIALLRATIDRILSLIEKCEDEDRKIKLYQTLLLATQRLSTAMRTQSLIAGDHKELLTTFWQAIERFREEHKL